MSAVMARASFYRSDVWGWGVARHRANGSSEISCAFRNSMRAEAWAARSHRQIGDCLSDVAFGLQITAASAVRMAGLWLASDIEAASKHGGVNVVKLFSEVA